jgi:TatD DNase family protein
MHLTDTHCHLDHHKFNEDRAAVLERARAEGVTRILVPGLDEASSMAALRLAESDPMVYAAVGFHPTDIDKLTDKSLHKLGELATQKHVVAIGEIGLDYYWVKEADQRARQRAALQLQLKLAQRVNKPIIIHLREADNADVGEAAKDILAILNEWENELRDTNHPLLQKPGVFHSFGGNLEIAKEVISRNYYIGITGPVTFKNAPERHALVAELPLERILIETDAPFLTPHPYRGKRNEPAFVGKIADKIAQLHSKDQTEVAEITSANAARLFGWGD